MLSLSTLQATEADSEKKHTREIEAQMMKCANDTYQQRQGETDEQALERAMRDPEVAKIMVSSGCGPSVPRVCY